MSDTIYSSDSGAVNAQNFVTVAQSASANLILTKRNYPDRQIPYDNVKHFNFYEVEIWNLWDLYQLSKRLLNSPRCCILRARIKDKAHSKHVVRKYLGDDATLILEDQNWFALDIDGLAGIDDNKERNIIADVNTTLLKLPPVFSDVECFAVASSSYGIKPGIRMRLFFWARNPVSNLDLKKFMLPYAAPGVDVAIFNPIQPIYTAAPIFIGMNDPVPQRLYWYPGDNIAVDIKKYERSQVQYEVRYTKQRAEKIADSTYDKISRLGHGERHNMLYGYSILLGKLIWQNLIDEHDTIEQAMIACEAWDGKRNVEKDMKTILDGIKTGKQAMERENV